MGAMTIDFSSAFLFINPPSSAILPSPIGEGGRLNFKLFEADSMLLCRSSKLVEGRNSTDGVVWAF